MIRLQKAQSVSIATSDPRKALDFYTEVLGFRLIALHGEGDGGVRAVLRVGAPEDESFFSLYFHPEIEKRQPIIDLTEPRDPANTVAPGALQHLAFTLPSLADLAALDDRLRAAGIWVLGPINHGFCHSSYCKGPEGIAFEFAADTDWPIPAEDWLDPATARRFGVPEARVKTYAAGWPRDRRRARGSEAAKDHLADARRLVNGRGVGNRLRGGHQPNRRHVCPKARTGSR